MDFSMAFHGEELVIFLNHNKLSRCDVRLGGDKVQAKNCWPNEIFRCVFLIPKNWMSMGFFENMNGIFMEYISPATI